MNSSPDPLPEVRTPRLAFAPGTIVFERYRLDRILGRGGMGEVWLARDQQLEREVALKFLPEIVARNADAIHELKAEARRALELTHPNIVRVHDFLVTDSLAAISMEYIQGRTLADVRRQAPTGILSPDEIAPWLPQIASALTFAHENIGLVHRDLKPSNLMVTANGQVKILDFGLSASVAESTMRLSNTCVSGTLLYMSPQQIRGRKPAVTDDIYALGATLYEMLAGKPPFFRGSIEHQILHEPPLRIADQRQETTSDTTHISVPAAWERTIMACLGKEPEQRPESAFQFLRHLQATSIEPTPEVKPQPEKILAAASAPTVAKPALKRVESVPGQTAVRDTIVVRRPKSVRAIGLGAIFTLIIGGVVWTQIERKNKEDAAAQLLRDAHTKRIERLQNASKDAPFVNSLGMKFVRIPDTNVLISIWETRERDANAIADPIPGIGGTMFRPQHESATAEYPMVNVSQIAASAFCSKLTEKERREGLIESNYTYRLAFESEWQKAQGPIPFHSEERTLDAGDHFSAIIQDRDAVRPDKVEGVALRYYSPLKQTLLETRRSKPAGWYIVSPRSSVTEGKANFLGVCGLSDNVLEWTFGGGWNHGEIRGEAIDRNDETEALMRSLPAGRFNQTSNVPIEVPVRVSAPSSYSSAAVGFRVVLDLDSR